MKTIKTNIKNENNNFAWNEVKKVYNAFKANEIREREFNSLKIKVTTNNFESKFISVSENFIIDMLNYIASKEEKI